MKFYLNNALRNLDDTIPNAPNFKYREFVKSDIAIRHNISNEPNEKEWQCIEALAVNILQPIRYKFGPLRITSGYRSIALCNLVKSNKFSNHVRGQAADFEPLTPGVKLIDVMNWIHDNCIYRELIAEYFPDGWIHCAYRRHGNIKVIKLKDYKHHYSKVDMNYINKLY